MQVCGIAGSSVEDVVNATLELQREGEVRIILILV